MLPVDVTRAHCARRSLRFARSPGTGFTGSRPALTEPARRGLDAQPSHDLAASGRPNIETASTSAVAADLRIGGRRRYHQAQQSMINDLRRRSSSENVEAWAERMESESIGRSSGMTRAEGSPPEPVEARHDRGCGLQA